MLALLAGLVIALVWHRIAPVEPLMRSITFALPMHPSSALTFVALDQGYFTAENLDVKVLEFPTGAWALADGVLAGKAQAGSSVELPLTLAILAGQDVRLLGALFTADNVNCIVARRSAGIAKPSDLRGRRVGVQAGTALHFFVNLFLNEHGLTENDVDMVFMAADDLPEALANGRVDAFAAREPFVSQSRDLLSDDVITFSQPGLYPQNETLVARTDWVRADPQAVEAMLRALLRAEIFAAEHPAEVISITARRLGIDEAVLRNFYRPRLELRVFLDQRLVFLMQAEARWAIANGISDQTQLPVFTDFIHYAPLAKLKPDAVTFIK